MSLPTSPDGREPLRVLQVHTRYRDRGGEDAVVETEAAVLGGAGHEVSRFEARNPTGTAAAAAALVRSPWNPSAAAGAVAAARRHRADVAHVHNTWFSMSPEVLRGLRRARVPTVMTLHNYRVTCSAATLMRDGQRCTLCVGSHPWHGVRHACYRGSWLQSVPAAVTIALHRRLDTWGSAVDRYIAPSAPVVAFLVAAGLPAERMTVVPHAVADPGPRRASPAASETVLYVGRLTPEKGVDTLLASFARLRGPLRLDVVGDGPARAALERQAPAGVRFLGALDPPEVAEAMKAARVLAFPSRGIESFGLAAVEAMAAGTPVLASAESGAGALVGSPPETTGSVLPADDVDAWTAALEQALDDSWVAEAGTAARRRYLDRFSTDAWLRRVEAVYASAVTTSRGAR